MPGLEVLLNNYTLSVVSNGTKLALLIVFMS